MKLRAVVLREMGPCREFIYIRFAMAEANDDPVPGEKRPRLRGVVTTVKGRASKKG